MGALDPWLERFAARDRQAIGEVQRLAERVVAFRGFGVPRAEREELVQETLTQIWQGIAAAGFDRARSFESFVRAVASRRCIDWRRTRRTLVELPGDARAREADPEKHLLAEERAAIGRKLLASLGDRCQELIRLHAQEDLTYAEIASRWGRSEGALRVQMSECLSRARLLFKRMREGEGAAT